MKFCNTLSTLLPAQLVESLLNLLQQLNKQKIQMFYLNIN